MVEFKNETPTISDIWNYTWNNKVVKSRFDYKNRDVLMSKIRLSERVVYKRNKEGKLTTAEERLIVESFSNPQYYPYIKGKKGSKQRKYRHHYDVILLIQKVDGIYSFWNSKIIWRTGSFKRVPKKIPQNMVKTIHADTKEKLLKKYEKLSVKERNATLKKEYAKIHKKGKYLSDGDYCAQVLGIMLDAYYRDYYIQQRFSCLYGRCWYNESTDGIRFPYADKHLIGCLIILMKKGILKYK